MTQDMLAESRSRIALKSLGWDERIKMNASKLSYAQKAFRLMQKVAGIPVAEICCRAGISQTTSFEGISGST